MRLADKCHTKLVEGMRSVWKNFLAFPPLFEEIMSAEFGRRIIPRMSPKSSSSSTTEGSDTPSSAKIPVQHWKKSKIAQILESSEYFEKLMSAATARSRDENVRPPSESQPSGSTSTDKDSESPLDMQSVEASQQLTSSLSSKLNTCYGVSFGDPLSPLVDNTEPLSKSLVLASNIGLQTISDLTDSSCYNIYYPPSTINNMSTELTPTTCQSSMSPYPRHSAGLTSNSQGAVMSPLNMVMSSQPSPQGMMVSSQSSPQQMMMSSSQTSQQQMMMSSHTSPRQMMMSSQTSPREMMMASQTSPREMIMSPPSHPQDTMMSYADHVSASPTQGQSMMRGPAAGGVFNPVHTQTPSILSPYHRPMLYIPQKPTPTPTTHMRMPAKAQSRGKDDSMFGPPSQS